MTEEEKIIRELRKDSWENISAISRKINIPLGRVFSKIKKMESGIIKKYTILLDYSKLGYNLRLFIAIKTRRKSELKRFLLKHPNVNTISRITNNYDFLIECIFIDMKEFLDFKEALQDVSIKRLIFYVIEEIKKEAFLADGS